MISPIIALIVPCLKREHQRLIFDTGVQGAQSWIVGVLSSSWKRNSKVGWVLSTGRMTVVDGLYMSNDMSVCIISSSFLLRWGYRVGGGH